MMPLVFFSFFIFLFSNTFGMGDSQRFARVPLVSQEEYARLAYPLSRSEQTEFEYARKELLNNPTSQAAQVRLKMMAEKGSVPALHPLISNAIQQKNVSDATAFSYQGASLGDSASALTLAALYSQPGENANEEEQNLKTRAMHGWLYNAAVPRALYRYDETKKEVVAAYVNDGAKQQLRTFLQEHQNEQEQLFLQYSHEQLNTSEKNILSGTNEDNSLACFLIKRHVQKASSESEKRAVGLAEKMVASSLFYPEQWEAAGVRTALESLTTAQTLPKIKTRVSQLLATWDQKEARRYQLVQVHPPEQPKPKFIMPEYSTQALQKLIDGAADNFEGIDRVDAAIYLNLHRDKHDKAGQAVDACLERALQDPDPAVRRALIEQCQLDSTHLYPFYVKAFNRYADELRTKNGLLQEEADFMNAQLQAVMKKADNGDGLAAYYAFQLLCTAPGCFTAVPADEREQVKNRYYQIAFDAGNWDILYISLPRIRKLALDTPGQLSKAMRAWSKVYLTSSQLLAAAPDNDIFAACVTESEEKITELLELKKARGSGSTVDDAAFYLQTAAALAQRDEKNARAAFRLGMEIVSTTIDHSEVTRRLYEATGLKNVLETCAKRGKGWAYFAQAHYTAISAINSGESRTLYQRAQSIIGAMGNARSLLRKAVEAAEPHDDFSEFNESDLDDSEGIAYWDLYSGDPSSKNSFLMQKALGLLQSSADKRNAKGMYHWAQATLAGLGQKGQVAFEKAVDYLIKAAAQNHGHAKEALQEIRKKGICFVAECGGTMTSAMRDAVNAQLGIPVVNSTPTAADSVQEYALIEQQANNGNIEAKVMQGLKLKEGDGVAKDVHKAETLFTDALLAWDGNPALGVQMAIAYAGLTDAAATNARAQIARCKSSIYTLFHGDTQNETVAREIIDGLENAQRLMQNGNEHLFYESGLAQVIQNCIEKHEHPNIFLYKLVDVYMQRIIAFPQEMQDSEKRQLLLAPVKELIKRIETIFTIKFVRIVMTHKEIQALNAVIQSLIKLMNQTTNYDLEYLKGLLLAHQSVAEPGELVFKNPGCHYRNPFTQETRALFNSLSNRGHMGARYMCAYIAVHGKSLHVGNINDVTQGIKLFEELAAKKDIRSLFALISIANDSKVTKAKDRLHQAKKIEGHLRAILEKDPKNEHAHAFLFSNYCSNPSLKPAHLTDKSTEQERVDYILSLSPKATLLNKSQIDFFNVLLRIRKQETSNELLDSLQTFLVQCESGMPENDPGFAVFKEYYESRDFGEKIDTWAQACIAEERKKEKPDDIFIARVHALHFWVHTIMLHANAQLTKAPIMRERCQELGKSATESGCVHPLMHCLQTYHHLRDIQTPNHLVMAQGTIAKAVSQMRKLNLKTISDVPLFDCCLNDYVLATKKFNPGKGADAERFVTIMKESLSK